MERVLLNEQTDEIVKLRAEAVTNCHRLNEAIKTERFTTKRELEILISSIGSYNDKELRKDEKLSFLMDNTDTKVKTPPHLIARENILRSVVNCFEYCKFVEGAWTIDEEKLSAKIETLKIYLVNEDQIKRLEFAKMVLDFTNQQLPFVHQFNIRLLNHFSIQYDVFMNLFKVNERWIISGSI